MTKRRQPNDVQPDRGDVLSLLKAIERIYNLCQEVLNTYTQTSLMLSLVIEAQMLVLKLKVMRRRWQYHLPFKEASKVKFDDWSHRVEKMAAGFADTAKEEEEPISEYCPSKHFLLDFYALLPEVTTTDGYTPYYEETVTSRFLVNQERIRQQITERWSSCYKQRFSDLVAEEIRNGHGLELQPLHDDNEVIRKACHDILMRLSNELSLLNDLQEPDIQPDQFARLADRVFAENDYKGRQARDSARRDVKEWKNKTPKGLLEQSRKGEIDTSMKLIEELTYGSQLADYIGDDLDIKGHSEGVGQFLHRVRKNISTEELNGLMEQLYRIRYFRENKEQEEKADAAKAAEANAQTAKMNAAPKLSQKPLHPQLPYFFKEALSENAEAVAVFYQLLHQTERYMSGRLDEDEKSKVNVNAYKLWKWNHLRVAFEKAGFIEKDTPKKYFAEFVHEVFPYLKAESVTRSIQRYSESKSGFDRIANDVVKEFAAVVTAMQNPKKH